MHFTEDDLRAALKRKDPGEGFTQRVMARVNQLEVEGKKPIRKAGWHFGAWWRLHPAWAAALAVALLFGFAFSGYEYSEYRHKKDMKVVQQNRQRLEEAERARDQAIRALEIARSKLSHVLQHAQLPVETNDKIRRNRL